MSGIYYIPTLDAISSLTNTATAEGSEITAPIGNITTIIADISKATAIASFSFSFNEVAGNDFSLNEGGRVANFEGNAKLPSSSAGTWSIPSAASLAPQIDEMMSVLAVAVTGTPNGFELFNNVTDVRTGFSDALIDCNLSVRTSVDVDASLILTNAILAQNPERFKLSSSATDLSSDSEAISTSIYKGLYAESITSDTINERTIVITVEGSVMTGTKDISFVPNQGDLFLVHDTGDVVDIFNITNNSGTIDFSLIAHGTSTAVTLPLGTRLTLCNASGHMIGVARVKVDLEFYDSDISKITTHGLDVSATPFAPGDHIQITDSDVSFVDHRGSAIRVSTSASNPLSQAMVTYLNTAVTNANISTEVFETDNVEKGEYINMDMSGATGARANVLIGDTGVISNITIVNPSTATIVYDTLVQTLLVDLSGDTVATVDISLNPVGAALVSGTVDSIIGVPLLHNDIIQVLFTVKPSEDQNTLTDNELRDAEGVSTVLVNYVVD